MQPPLQSQSGILVVNNDPLNHIRYLQQSRSDDPLDKLRRHYENGYLFLKGPISRDVVLKARYEYFAMIQLTGVLEAGTKPVRAIITQDKSQNSQGLVLGLVR
ncbi:uncharacterized protein N7482_008027 [Penicillium canariense]|uniref:Uncharacterized protein n=1 Tax=Penicillium canariense TaxID=189055 RepID=A0A9W9LID2_9EURO|nr:uncharacterized protein N7482_008027 [Penicillium canariense]KAJ5156927.1 hypothetical protein N7482_008027 [Penicillium canariense]